MKPKYQHLGCQPTQLQAFLLKAALLSGSDAIAAWESWRSRVDIDHLDQSSYQLLPLLYRNLQRLGVNDTLMEKIKGVYRLTWTRNQVNLPQIDAMLDSFQNANIATIVLGGVAIALLYYQDIGARMNYDLGVIVHPQDIPKAMALITKLGWEPTQLITRENNLLFTHYLRYTKDKQFINLYWHLLPDCSQLDAETDFWQVANFTQIEQVVTFTLNPTDQLFSACVYATQWNLISPFCFLADAVMLVRTQESAIDWNRLLSLAKKYQLTLAIKHSLNFLTSELNVAVPIEVLQRLENTSISNRERIEYQANTNPQWVGDYLIKHLFKYQRLFISNYKQLSIVGFMQYLEYHWQIQHRWQLPIYFILKGIRKLHT